YQWWDRGHGPTRRDREKQRRAARRATEPLTVGIVLLGPDEGRRETATLRSLRKQTWHHWRLAAPRRITAEGGDDERIVVVDAAATIADRVRALDLAPRDLVVVLEPGDRLTPGALFHIVRRAWRLPTVDVVYWDDDLTDGLGVPTEPRFRPAWSPDMLLGANYIGRSFAMRARLVEELGGPDVALGDAQWWDLLLRADLSARRVDRVPQVLAHLTRRPSPTADDRERVVGQHLERHGEHADVAVSGDAVRVRWAVEHWPSVTIIVPTRHHRENLRRCLDGLLRTDYEPFDVIIVDNGARTDDNEAWYAAQQTPWDLTVRWWDRPFNYSAVNNAAAADARGEVLVFLNDDTEVIDPGWLRELVSWAVRPELGVVGLQLLDGEGRIQHGGVVLGMNGFADHLFEGMEPGSDSLFGSTDWYRNVLAVTAACLAVRRELFEELGGFDERFQLCGSDVVLGLDATIAGRRNLCLPSHTVRHLEATTRGSEVPSSDFFASYWRYQPWIFGGDPYFSPNLSLVSRRPRLRPKYGDVALDLLSGPLHRRVGVFRQRNETVEAAGLADLFRATDADVARVRETHAAHRHDGAPRSITWFLPDMDSPFYGGVNTALRIADYLSREHGVENRFAFWAPENDGFFRSAITAAFPSLADAPIGFYQKMDPASLNALPVSDVSIATLWATAYAVAKAPVGLRRFYLIQDFEPEFYPAGSLYALAEESYRLGLYGLCNTPHLLDLYRDQYQGEGGAFLPAVDTNIFHAEGRTEPSADDPVTVFVYARPGHFRNCWELASIALEQLKRRLGDRVTILTAGSWAYGDNDHGIEHLGMLDLRATGHLYRRCDVGVALTVSEHPSYLPLELMACGVPVVAFDNPAGSWLLEHEVNSLLTRRTVDALCEGVERLVVNAELRACLREGGLRTIAARHASWDDALGGV
ncbi:MAG TPA: glycosyltransferase, partial [Acidimicrobiia bacterium]|nr:glycosyltransferase [Acidimicrobiia bacterium]